MKEMRLTHSAVFKMVIVTALFISGLGMLEGQEFAGGQGTEADPWQIATAEHLNNVRNYLGEEHNDKHFIQTANIDLDIPPFNDNEGWLPIGAEVAENRFTGSYDGDGNVISNLFISRGTANYQGLFGYIEGARLENISLEDIYITARQYVGGLAAYQNNSLILNCSVNGRVESVDVSDSYAGGMIGYKRFGTGETNAVLNSYSDVEVAGTNYVGGLVGDSWEGDIVSCRAGGNIKASNVAGGLIGYARGLVRECSAEGNVTASSSYIGGLLGVLEGGEVRDCYAVGEVEGNDYVGGLAGGNAGLISNSFSIGYVTGDTETGGLIGGNLGIVRGSYWDVNTSNQQTSAGGTGRSTLQMITADNYQNWDFEDVWETIDGMSYPWLEFQAGPNIPGPGNLTGAGDDESIDLNWQAPVIDAQPIGYNVYRDNLRVNADVIEAREYQDTGLDNWKPYDYFITAVFEAGESFKSNTIECLAYSFAGGSGSEEDPYLVETANQLYGVRFFLDSDFRQIEDIDLGTPPFNENEGWEPIGIEDELDRFTGSYDGNENRITNLYINREQDDYQGLFGYAENASLSNIFLENVIITARQYVGGLTAFQHNTRITNCYSSGSVRSVNIATSYIGGIAGYKRFGDEESNAVTNSFSSANISGGNFAGGLVGYSREGDILSCWATGDVRGNQNVGGLVGYNWSNIRDSFASGNITAASSYAGGLAAVGRGNTENSYALGDVRGTSIVGGLLGRNQGLVTNCYSIGRVEGNQAVGGLIGNQFNGEVENSYWDVQTSHQAESAGGSGRATLQLLAEATYQGWDFENIWRIIEGLSYPKLQSHGFLNIPGPQNLESDAGNEIISLNWQAPVIDLEPLGYNIYRDDIQINDELVQALQYQDIGVNNWQFFNYYITAVYEEGETFQSNIVTAAAFNFAGGTGTEDDPFLVETSLQLNGIRFLLSAHFRQIDNIDLGVPPWNENDGWIPIGTERPAERFTGSFDGNGYLVTNLYIDREVGRYQGLFGYIEEAKLEDISLENVDVRADDYIGGLAGYQNNSIIANCSTSGWIESLNSFSSYTGGLIGKSRYGDQGSNIITESYSTVNVDGANHCGGLVGYSIDGMIKLCRAAGNVTGNSNIGGLAGYSHSDIRESFASGNIQGLRHVGGFVGYNRGSVAFCYSSGGVTGERNVGGLIGTEWEGQTENSYWDTETSGQQESDGGTGRLTRQMVYPYDDETYTGWDFNEIWLHDLTGLINDGYPILYYQEIILDAPEVTVEIVTINEIKHVCLRWEEVEDARSYKIYASAEPNAEDWGEPVEIVGADVTVYVETIHESGKKFFYVTASIEEAP